MRSKPSPNTPITFDCDTKAAGSMLWMMRKMLVLSRFLASTTSTLRSCLVYHPWPLSTVTPRWVALMAEAISS